MSRFNLIDEKWIPVRFPDGTRGELGIRDTLLRSTEIAGIEDPSPLVYGRIAPISPCGAVPCAGRTD